MNDVFICDAIRTPIGRYGGVLSSVRTDDLGAVPIKALMTRSPSLDWTQVDDVLCGCANQAGEDNRDVARMSGTGENVATDFRIKREDQDRFALASRSKASRAQADGTLVQEITAVTVAQKKRDPLIVDRDEHPSATSMEALAKLKGVVRPDGTVTAGNASGVDDGACVLLSAGGDAAKTHGLMPKWT